MGVIAQSQSGNSTLSHDQTIELMKRLITEQKLKNEERKAMLQKMGPQFINPKNYRTVPCRNYHGPTGCTRGDFCHYIHAVGYERT